MRKTMGLKKYFHPELLYPGLAVLFLALSAPSAAKTIDEIALVVDQESMTSGEMEESIQAYYLSQRLTPPAKGTAAYERTKKEIVEGFVREVLMAKEADRMQIDGESEVDFDGNCQRSPYRENLQVFE